MKRAASGEPAESANYCPNRQVDTSVPVNATTIRPIAELAEVWTPIYAEVPGRAFGGC